MFERNKNMSPKDLHENAHSSFMHNWKIWKQFECTIIKWITKAYAYDIVHRNKISLIHAMGMKLTNLAFHEESGKKKKVSPYQSIYIKVKNRCNLSILKEVE